MGKFLIVIIVFFLVWDVVWWVLGVKPLFPWQLRKRLAADFPPPLLLDVRTPFEFNWFHLPGAQNHPDLLLDASTMPAAAPAQDVVVICMTGHRSPFVAHTLKKRGFPRVYNLTWGMAGWKLYAWLSGASGSSTPPNESATK